ncbi:MULTISPECIES: amidohydrolase [unclassified Streptomyces]|uniref:amidohydrolase n=1 Tax=unclassified Streptomyces TaxID=2593676 RepID=UPI001F0456B4|nr:MULTISPECIES: amidohydrolase [unclassified Streptomyces]MCH0561754.1 amidohydrolase [Streptomyces sp. MUM 2J]MCH0571636.1 amidohydrolase [Streptomyces sp. MUM 136J]
MTSDDFLYDHADRAVGRWSARLLALSRAVHAEPETAFAEHGAAARVAEVLQEAGFDVERGVCDLPTALTATAGEGDLTVGICAEYDALPGVGHACGHNLIAAAGVGAAIGLAAVADRLGLRVKLLGTPAEEHGGGKVLMLERGAFDDVAVAMMVHPGPTDLTFGGDRTTAAARFEVVFRGRTAHSAKSPHEALNAGDAAVVAQVAVGLLRQQITSASRVAGFVREAGQRTNMIPERAVLEYEVRAPAAGELAPLTERVLDCFRGAAIATGTTADIRRTQPDYLDLRQDPWLLGTYERHLKEFGRAAEPVPPGSVSASTDMGNVSHVLPSIHPHIGVLGCRATPHHAEFADEMTTPAADTALLDAARLLARTGVDLARDAERRDHYVRAHRRRLRGGAAG